MHSNVAGAILTLTLALSLPTEKARSMAQLLLKLGATCSQADADGCTVFHRYVDSGNVDMVETLIDNDPRGVQAAVNHLFFSGYMWRPDIVSPLQSALEKGDPILVLKVLNAGASVEIDFDAWLKSAKVAPSQTSNLGNLEQTKKRYEESIEQPLIAAIRSGNTDLVIQLLEKGANPNSVTRETQYALANESQRNWTKGTTALDMVKRLITKLREYSGEKYAARKPEKQPGIDSYLEKFEPGTYQHWLVAFKVKTALERYQTEKDNYEKEARKVAERRGNAEKVKAIKESISDLVELESVLIAKGALVFDELYPDIKMENRHNYSYVPPEPPKVTEYEYKFVFNGDSDMTEGKKDGYLQL